MLRGSPEAADTSRLEDIFAWVAELQVLELRLWNWFIFFWGYSWRSRGWTKCLFAIASLIFFANQGTWAKLVETMQGHSFGIWHPFTQITEIPVLDSISQRDDSRFSLPRSSGVAGRFWLLSQPLSAAAWGLTTQSRQRFRLTNNTWQNLANHVALPYIVQDHLRNLDSWCDWLVINMWEPLAAARSRSERCEMVEARY